MTYFAHHFPQKIEIFIILIEHLGNKTPHTDLQRSCTMSTGSEAELVDTGLDADDPYPGVTRFLCQVNMPSM